MEQVYAMCIIVRYKPYWIHLGNSLANFGSQQWDTHPQMPCAVVTKVQSCCSIHHKYPSSLKTFFFYTHLVRYGFHLIINSCWRRIAPFTRREYTLSELLLYYFFLNYNNSILSCEKSSTLYIYSKQTSNINHNFQAFICYWSVGKSTQVYSTKS